MEVVKKQNEYFVRLCARCESTDTAIKYAEEQSVKLKLDEIMKLTHTQCVDCIAEMHPDLFTPDELEGGYKVSEDERVLK